MTQATLLITIDCLGGITTPIAGDIILGPVRPVMSEWPKSITGCADTVGGLQCLLARRAWPSLMEHTSNPVTTWKHNLRGMVALQRNQYKDIIDWAENLSPLVKNQGIMPAPELTEHFLQQFATDSPPSHPWKPQAGGLLWCHFLDLHGDALRKHYAWDGKPETYQRATTDAAGAIAPALCRLVQEFRSEFWKIVITGDHGNDWYGDNPGHGHSLTWHTVNVPTLISCPEWPTNHTRGQLVTNWNLLDHVATGADIITAPIYTMYALTHTSLRAIGCADGQTFTTVANNEGLHKETIY